MDKKQRVFTLVITDENAKLLNGPEVFSSVGNLCDRLAKLMGYPDEQIEEDDDDVLDEIEACLKVNGKECSFERGGISYCCAVAEVV